jgi:16S rRNA (guanine966-N2)-methyltransferase
MRVVAGEFKGRTLEAPKGRDTRPTIDRVREAMFSSILSMPYFDIEGAQVLDAFGGSGALGIEALSRGAMHCTFFDTDDRARDAILSNLTACRIPTRMSSRGTLNYQAAEVTGSDVLKAASRGAFLGHPVSLVLLDPPYALPSNTVFSFLLNLKKYNMLTPNAVIVYEHDAKSAFAEEELPADFVLYGRKTYGQVGVSFIRPVEYNIEPTEEELEDLEEGNKPEISNTPVLSEKDIPEVEQPTEE